jgi:hypothetical protein
VEFFDSRADLGIETKQLRIVALLEGHHGT